LVALAQAGKKCGLHGYGILRAIEEVTKGLRKYALPSLYEALRTLREQGLIELYREVPESGRLRKYFRITGTGERSMKDYLQEMERIQQSVRGSLPALKPVRG